MVGVQVERVRILASRDGVEAWLLWLVVNGPIAERCGSVRRLSYREAIEDRLHIQVTESEQGSCARDCVRSVAGVRWIPSRLRYTNTPQ